VGGEKTTEVGKNQEADGKKKRYLIGGVGHAGASGTETNRGGQPEGSDPRVGRDGAGKKGKAKITSDPGGRQTNKTGKGGWQQKMGNGE